MKICVDDTSIRFGDQALSYETYYLDNDTYANLSNAVIVKNILSQWAIALSELHDEDRELYLPYSFDDEWVECFKVTKQGKRLIFEQVWVKENGWALDISDLKNFINSSHGIRKKFPAVFGTYDKDDIISSLLNAEVGCTSISE